MTELLSLTSKWNQVKEPLRIINQEPSHNQTTDYNTNFKFESFANRYSNAPENATPYIKP